MLDNKAVAMGDGLWIIIIGGWAYTCICKLTVSYTSYLHLWFGDKNSIE